MSPPCGLPLPCEEEITSSEPALKITNAGSGNVVNVLSSPGTPPALFPQPAALRASNLRAEGRAGFFEISDADNDSPTLEATTSSTSPEAFAVLGVVSSESSGYKSAGVRGINKGTAKGEGEIPTPPKRAGVWGSQDGEGDGVLGESRFGTGVSGSGFNGVVGTATDTTGRSSGVVGNAQSPGGFGVTGVNHASRGAATGVDGKTFSGDDGAAGVLGTVSEMPRQRGGRSSGVHGVNNRDFGAAAGVRGEHTGKGAGVVGNSSTGIGVLAATDTSGEDGKIFVGRAPGNITQVRFDGNGKGFFNGGTATGGADFAWSTRTTDDPSSLEPGDVLSIDSENPHRVKKSREANSRLVAGVYSTKPSVLSIGEHHIDDSLQGEVPVAVVGIVPTKVTAQNGPICIGDLLTSAPTPGYAMKAKPVAFNGIELYPTGAILGKALERCEKGTGKIKVLVTLQ